MKKNAWSSPVYQEGRKLIEAGKDFRIVNEFGEWKEFKAGSSHYTVQYLATVVNCETACGYDITIERL